MEYQRKLHVDANQDKKEPMFQGFVMHLSSKRGMPLCYIVVMILMIIILWYNYVQGNMELIFAIIASILFGGITLLQVLILNDHIDVYEYGFIQTVNLRKQAIAYDDIEYIEEKRMRKKQMFPSMWILYRKDNGKRIVIDASAYHNLEAWMKRLEAETNISIHR